MNPSSLLQHSRTWRFAYAIPRKIRSMHQSQIPLEAESRSMPLPAIASQRSYMPALDGLRALSVIAVVAYHLNFSFAQGGLMGVNVFFVLSGFLITDILLHEWQEYGKINLRQFWLHRMRRLLPALFTMLLLVVGFMAITQPTYLEQFYGDILSAIFYVSNWWYIFHHVSYFSQYGVQSPFLHLWSLAVEEQFYLVWPILLLFGLRFLRTRGWLFLLIILGSIASALAMAFLYQPFMDPSRVYYGTDTRAFSLLIGAALALLMIRQKPVQKSTKKISWSFDAVGILSLLILLLVMVFSNEYQPTLYQGGMVFLSLVTAALIAVLAHPGSRLGAVFSFRPLRYLGQRSYGIYLWHYPIIVLTTPIINASGTNCLLIISQITASLIMADLSWRFIETPIRHGKLPFSHRHRKKQELSAKNSSTKFYRNTFVVITCFSFLILGVGYADLNKMSKSDTVSAKIIASRHTQLKPGYTQTKPVITQKPKPSWHKNLPAKVQVQQVTRVVGKEVTAIGDSIMIDIKPYLQRDLPGIWVDGMVGRQMYQLENTLTQLRANRHLRANLIIELGTNGSFNETSIATLLRSLHEKRIIIVNTRVPRSWQESVNESLAQLVAQVPHALLVNWYKASANHNTYFSPDGVHLDPQGAATLAQLVTNSLKS